MEFGSVRIQHVPDIDQDLSYLEPLPDDDYEERARKQGRMDAYERGDWQPVGVVAKLRVGLEHGTALFQSPGVWGVESDDPAIGQIEREQIDELKAAVVEAVGDSEELSESIWRAVVGRVDPKTGRSEREDWP